MNLFSRLILGLDTKAFRSGIANADKSLKTFSLQLKNIGGLIGATFIGSQLTSFTKEAIEMGSQLQKASAGFARFGSEMDLENLRKQTRGLVNDVQLMQQTVKGANLGIPFEQMGTLLEFAKRRADETGESVDYLINSIIEGIGKKSTLRLDNLGIAADRLRSKIGGVSLEMASVADVSRAMVDIANEELGKMGTPVDTATDAVTRLYVAWDNLKASIGEDIGPLITGAISGLEEFWNASVALFQGRYIRDILVPMFTEPSDIAPGVPNATVPMDPNRPEGPAKTAAPFGVYAPAPDTIQSIQEGIKALKDQYEATAINTAEFYRLAAAIQAAEQQLRDLTDGVVPYTEKATVQAKGLEGVNVQLEQHGKVMKQIPAVGNEYTKWLETVAGKTAEWDSQLVQMTIVAQQFGHILSTAFEASMINGENFFESISNGFKKYVQQMLAMAAATTALAVAIAFVTGGANFKEAFNAVGGTMGLPFGFSEEGELKLRVSGFDMTGKGIPRQQKGLNIMGN